MNVGENKVSEDSGEKDGGEDGSGWMTGGEGCDDPNPNLLLYYYNYGGLVSKIQFGQILKYF